MAATPIEAYPHLTQKICALWGSWELEDFVQHLILDSRDGGRQGFPMEVAAELLFLAQCNKTLRTLVLAKQLSVRYDEASRALEAGDRSRQGASHWSDPRVAKDVAKTTATSSAIKSSSALPQPAAARTSRAPARKGASGGQSGGKVVGLLLFRILPILVLALVAGRYLQRFI